MFNVGAHRHRQEPATAFALVVRATVTGALLPGPARATGTGALLPGQVGQDNHQFGRLVGGVRCPYHLSRDTGTQTCASVAVRHIGTPEGARQ